MIRRMFANAWRLLCLWGFYWARREINPLHPDLPYIMRRISQLESQK